MMERWICTILMCMMWCCYQSWAFPRPGMDPGLNRTRRAVRCAEIVEYRHGDVCCKSCPAGTRLKTPCSGEGGHSECEECNLGTFTALENELKKCLSCSLCRSDQEVVHPCISTHNTECQCKPGGFCDPDQACEVCKRCARCGNDEIVVRNCTPTSNTECKKKPEDSKQASDRTPAYVVLGLAVSLVLLVVALVFCMHRRKRKAADSGRSQARSTPGCNGAAGPLDPSPGCWSLVRPRSLPAENMAEEQRSLREGSGSTSNSRDNLIITSLSTCSAPAAPCSAPAAPCSAPAAPCSAPAVSSYAPALTLHRPRVEQPQFNIHPVNGHNSLKSCFEFFEELDVHYHSRFFRHLGLSDNKIKSKDSLMYTERVHDLLNLWLEQRGREASLKDLLGVLMNLGQRRTAEIIVERAVEAGLFEYDSPELPY